MNFNVKIVVTFEEAEKREQQIGGCFVSASEWQMIFFLHQIIS